MRTEKTDVLVVGAGPIGLFTALQLAEQNIDTIIIDRESYTAAHSYACALHQATLPLLEKFELLDQILENGRRINTVSFYEGSHCRAEVHLSEINAAFPFIVVVPQNWIEDALERALDRAGVRVRWQHRYRCCEGGVDGVRAIVDRLGGSGFGYGVPHWESLVEQTFAIDAQFIIGADGPNSSVRRNANFVMEEFGSPLFFVVYEFETGSDDDAVNVVLRPNSTDVLWPLPDNRARWTFQLAPIAEPGEFPEKEREHFLINQGKIEDRICSYARQLARERAPWFTGEIKQVVWRTPVQFGSRIVKELVRDRVILVGDAAHQTMPFGMQSMNAGLHESKVLVDALKQIIQSGAPAEFLREYSDETTQQWKQLLDGHSVSARKSTNVWVRKHRASIAHCLPAVGPDLDALLNELKLTTIHHASHAPLL